MRKMKNYFRIGIFLFVSSLLLWSCETDDEIIERNPSTSKFILKKVYTNSIQDNIELKGLLEKFNSKKSSSSIQEKGVYNEEYGITIDTEVASYIEEENKHSYTFSTTQNNENKIVNVLFSSNEDGGYDSFLVEYDYSYNELNSLSKEELSSQTKFTPINIELSSLQHRTKSTLVCVYSYERVKVGTKFVEVSDSHLFEDVYEWILVARSCHTVTYEIEADTQHSSGSTTTSTGGTNYGGSGYTTTPMQPSTPYEGEELTKLTFVKDQLKLNLIERQWADKNGQTIFKMYDLLEKEMLSDNAKNWAKGHIKLDIYKSKITIKYNPGKVKGRDDLKYTHIGTDGIRTVYKLETGDLVLSSIQKEYLNNYENGIWTSEVSNSEFWYIKPIDTGEWAQFLVKENFTNLSDELETLFILGSKLGGKFFGRYVFPVEDVKILITGTDFDGQQANQYLTTGMLLISVVPGGKLLKAVPKITKGTKVWRIILKEGSHNYTRIIKEISEVTLQKFDNATTGIRDLIDEALRNNEYLDDVIEEVAEIVEDLAEKKGSKLTWAEVKALFKRGNDFNRKAENIYEYNEIVLATGKRLDSYIPNIAIISRKATTLSNIKPETFKSYLKELITKYPKNSSINAPKFGSTFGDQVLKGDYFLEIPLSNKTFFENSSIFQNVLSNFNNTNNVIIKIKYLAE